MINISTLKREELWKILSQEPELLDLDKLSIKNTETANEYLNQADLKEYEIIDGQKTGYYVTREAFVIRSTISRLITTGIKFIQQFYSEGPTFANGNIHHFTQHCILYTERPQSTKDLICPRTMLIRMHNYTNTCNTCKTNFYGEARVVKILEPGIKSDLAILDLKEIAVVEIVHYDGITITDSNSKFKQMDLRDIKLVKHPFRD